MVELSSNEHPRQRSFIQRILRTWKWMISKILVCVFRCGTYMLHISCTVIYSCRRKVVPPIENQLLLKSATQLAADIREGRIKSEAVVQAYINRIQEVEPYINATVHQRFSEAIKEAREADALVASGKMNRNQIAAEKPLLGIPLSVKMLIQIEGLPFTGASLDAKDVIGSEDADVIIKMKKAGAIILVTTNAPEKGLDLETSNKLHGRTNNPYDTSRSPCGSSGGEAALIGSGASLIGIGNDTAGSLRMPSLFCGIYAHKPSKDMISIHGQFAYVENVTSIGPMCRYAEDLMTTMKVLSIERDITIKENLVNFRNLKIFYALTMGSPASLSLDRELKDAFLKVLSFFEITHGIKAVEVKIPQLKKSEATFLHCLINAAGDTETIKKAMRVPPEVSPKKELLKYFLGFSKYTIIVPFMLNLLKLPLWYRKKDVPYYLNILNQFQHEFDGMLDENSIFLCPTLPRTAMHHVETQSLVFSLSYVGLWNFLGLPATHCPIGLNEKGLPLGVQIISRKNNDALNFAIAEELEKVFGGWIAPGQTK